MYHHGQRELQDLFDSRALADRLDEKLRRERFNDADAAFVARAPSSSWPPPMRTESPTARSRAACPASSALSRRIC